MKAVRVKKEIAEEVRKFAEKIGAKDKRRLIRSHGDYVEIPILPGYEEFFKEFEIVEVALPENPRKNLTELLKDILPKEKLAFAPKSYKIVGDIAIVKFGDEVAEYGKLIGATILKQNPRLKSVWRDKGKEGMIRKPYFELLAGEGSETVHVENGFFFKLDVTKVMFSLGNQYERMRIAQEVASDEIVVDMFAGIGYFSIPIAKRAKKVYAIEINPESYRYLVENMELNKLKNIIPVLGDSMFVTPERIADRVVMGHIFCTDFLPTAIRAIAEDGFLHYHESVPEKIIWRAAKRVEKACGEVGRKCKILKVRRVKNYAPGVVHVVVDAFVH
ncbi:MAG: class I SAM-dependent methyltransferase family protein [Archaeoglobaceae archaeon]